MKRILYYIFISFVILILLFLLSSRLPSAKHQVMIVLSGSMEPAIKTGSVVFVLPVKHYEIGNVITFKNNNEKEKSTTHRIKNTEVVEGKMLYITKGDANENVDARKVTENEIIGRTVFWIPYIGYVVDFAKRPIGLLIIILVPGVMIVVGEGKKILREVKRIKEEG